MERKFNYNSIDISFIIYKLFIRLSKLILITILLLVLLSFPSQSSFTDMVDSIFWEHYLHLLPCPFPHIKDEVSTSGVRPFLSRGHYFFLPSQLLCNQSPFYIIHCCHPQSVTLFETKYISIWINVNVNVSCPCCCLCCFGSDKMFHSTYCCSSFVVY